MKKIGVVILIFLNIVMAKNFVTFRQNYYTSEDSAELFISLEQFSSTMALKKEGQLLSSRNLQKGLNRFKIAIDRYKIGQHSFSVEIDGKTESVTLKKLPQKQHCVKIDKQTGGLIVEDNYFYPFGFYCYSPVQKRLAEQEVVKGFNLMSPYQEINRKNRKDRKAYLDRCAELGMKVNYNLCSIAGGGGVGSHGRHQFTKESEKLLIEEINYFKEHPAILSWYIADEPVGQNIPVEQVENIYNIIKREDPYHPISVVFMTPSKAPEYAEGMDIVMTDPYPVPGGKIDIVSTITKQLMRDFNYQKPIWLVPQAFGGNEFWKREPTAQELRTMTYQGIMNGATGVQYFIRHGLNSFPKSTVTWHEAGKIAHEVRSIADFLLSYDNRIFLCNQKESVDITAWQRSGEWIIGVVNKEKHPQKIACSLPIKSETIRVLFDNRIIETDGNSFVDWISGYDARFYRLNPEINRTENLFINPGFETNYAPAIPAGCYANVTGDPGGTYFLDKTEPFEGETALSIITPRAGEIALQFYKSRLKVGNRYRVSFMAKHDNNYFIPPLSFAEKVFNFFHKNEPHCQIALGELGQLQFLPTDKWQQYEFYITNDSNDKVNFSPQIRQNGPIKVWYDHLQIMPDPTFNYVYDQEHIIITVETESDFQLKYKINDRKWLNYETAVKLENSGTIYAGLFDGKKKIAVNTHYFEIHKGLNCPVKYEELPTDKYFPGKDKGLTDGLRGSEDFLDGKWQGIEKADLVATIDLGAPQLVSELSIGFLQNIGSWIFMPESVTFFISEDGENYQQLKSLINPISPKKTGAQVHEFTIKFPKQIARYVRIRGKNRAYCPKWHRSQGGKAFIFCDEIVIR